MTTSCSAALEAGLGHRFVRPEHLARRADASLVQPEAPNNETLEFLGDAVLALADGRPPDARASRRRARATCRSCAPAW